MGEESDRNGSLATDQLPAKSDTAQVRRFIWVVSASLLIATGLLVFYKTLLIPVVVALVLSYILVPYVDDLQGRRLPRWLVSSGMVVAASGFVVVSLVTVIPALYEQIMSLLQMIPGALSVVVDYWVPRFESQLSQWGLSDWFHAEDVFSAVDIIEQLRGHVQAGLAGIWTTGSTLVGGVVNVVMAPVLMFFFLCEKPKVVRTIGNLIPPDQRAPMKQFVQNVDSTLRTVLKGQVIVASTLLVLYVIGFSIVDFVWGLQAALGIAVVAGICRVVPYFDVIIGGVLSLIAIVSGFHGWGPLFGVVMVFVIVQSIDGIFITPRVIGERIGLHPVVVIISILAFADWLGFWGVLMAIPAMAVLKTVFAVGLPYYRESKWFQATWLKATSKSES